MAGLTGQAALEAIVAVFGVKPESWEEREAIRLEGAGGVGGRPPHLTCTQRITSYSPAQDSVAVGIYFDAIRKARLKKKYGWGMGLPKLSPCLPELPETEDASVAAASDVDRRLQRKDVPVSQLAAADALREIGLEKRADRRRICGLVVELWQCPCGKTWKTPWGCKLRCCPGCSPKLFDRAFSKLVPLDDYIPSSLRSQPGWGWKILDFTFHHDGEFAPRDELRKMRQVVNRTFDVAVREKCAKKYEAAFYRKHVLRNGKLCAVRALCPVRFDEGMPMMSAAHWPLVSVPDGSVRELVGWDVVHVGRFEKRPTCVRCGSRVKKVKKERARLCPKCGPSVWPDWENREIDARRWRLRFGVLHVPVSEFGFDGVNYHFHTAFFGPYLPNNTTCQKCGSLVRRSCRTCGSLVKRNEKAKRGWDCSKCGHVDRNAERKLGWYCSSCGAVDKIVDGRLTQIFRQESKKALGVESRGVWIEKAEGGYRAALAHALKYTAKPPASESRRLAAYEKALVGVRRYAVRGFLQGVEIAEVKPDGPRCRDCRKTIRKIPGMGLVPFFEVEDIPLLKEPVAQIQPPRETSEDWLYGSWETVAHGPRAP